MASFAVSAEGQRCTVKLTPMQPLGTIVDQARDKLKLTGSSSVLKFGNTVLDLNLPLRFANVPAGAKLELDTGVQKRLGLLPQPPADAVTTSADPTSSRPAAPEASTAPLRQSAELTDGAALSPPASAYRHHTARPPEPSHLASSFSNSTDPAANLRSVPQDRNAASALQTAGTSSQAQPAHALRSSSVISGVVTGQAAPQTSSAIAPGDRQIRVFSRLAAEQQEEAHPSVGAADPPPEFYDFTAEDYHRVMAGQAHAAAQAGAGMRTAAMRRADTEAAASRLGPVPLRIHFPGDVVVQAEFRALEPLSHLRELIQSLLAPSIKTWHVYTTPPKQIIKDWSASLYEAHLVPAAHLHVSMGSSGVPSGPCLKPEVLASMAEPPPRAVASATGTHEPSPGAARPSATGLDARPAEVSAREAGAAGGKKPKWMKIGK